MYFYIEEDENKYSIKMTENFYKYTTPYFHQSYFNIMYRLFDLMPRDFYHYVGYTYHAVFQKSKYINFIHMYFENINDAKQFCKELNLRFQYCVDREYFS